LAPALAGRRPLEAFQEIGSAGEGVLTATAGETLQGCCQGWAAPAGLFKAMQAAAGPALPKDVAIRVSNAE